MNYDKLQGKGIFVFSDPAGAKAVLAQAYFLQKENLLSDFKIISDRKYDFFADFGLEVLPYSEEEENELVKNFFPNFIFTGTSYTSKIELKFIEQATKHDILSVAFIDHWTNFRNRFLWDEKFVLPNEIWVIDEKAKNLAIQDSLPAEKLQIVGNPYYDFLKIWKPDIPKEVLLRSIDLPENASYILYVPEPLSQVGGIEKFGFDEYEVLHQIIAELSEKFSVTLQGFLLVKPHPNHQLGKFEEIIAKAPQNILLLDSKTPINLLMFYADCVVGLFSNALIEGKLIGAKVIRLLPERCKIELMENDIEICKKLNLIV